MCQYEKPLGIVYREQWDAAINDPEMPVMATCGVRVLAFSLFFFLYYTLSLQMSQNQKPLGIVYREQWDAAINDPEMPVMPGPPAEFVLLTYTDTDPCLDDETCMRIVKGLQTKHMKSGMDDIQWNFMVGGDGQVYEGRGWELCADKDVEFQDYHEKSIDIAYIGRFGEKHVTPIMEEAVKKLVEIGIKELYIAPKHDYIGHREHVGFQG